MKTRKLACRGAAALALAVAMTAGAARADLVLKGSDYFETTQPTFFTPLGGLNPLKGQPIGPGTTDTIVQRLADCPLNLLSVSSCTIPIEMTALSLVSTVNPSVRLRESPTLASAGAMTITSNGSGSGGTFSSFFDVFFEISLDGGGSFTPGGPLHLTSSGTAWSTIASGLLVNGLVGDQAANFHTNKNSNACPGFNATVCVDFFSGPVREAHPDGSVHSAQSATTAVPEPGSVALFGLGLAAIAGLRRRRA